MSRVHTGNVDKAVTQEEHRSKGDVHLKATLIHGYNPATDSYYPLTVVESTDYPGYYGLLVLNGDGSTISAGTGGGTTTPTYDRVTSTGDIRVTATGDTRIYV